MTLYRVDVSDQKVFSGENYQDIIQWMRDELGYTARDWMWETVRETSYPHHRTAYYFKNPEHALLFKLTWSDIGGTGNSSSLQGN